MSERGFTTVENLVNGIVARRELGKPGPPIGATRFSALKRAAGMKGRYVLVSKLRAYLHEHPGFSERDIYQRKINA